MAGKLKKEKQKVYLSPGNLKRKMIPRIFFMSYLGINVIALTGIPVYASDIFATAKNAMQTVYTDVAGIATVAAVVCAAVCLFLMNFSKSGRTVDESRSWLKRIVCCMLGCTYDPGCHCNIFGKNYSEKYVYGLMYDFLPVLSRFLKGGYLLWI